jgi:hypothetical protein
MASSCFHQLHVHSSRAQLLKNMALPKSKLQHPWHKKILVETDHRSLLILIHKHPTTSAETIGIARISVFPVFTTKESQSKLPTASPNTNIQITPASTMLPQHTKKLTNFQQQDQSPNKKLFVITITEARTHVQNSSDL